MNTPKVYGYEKDCQSRRTDDSHVLEFKLDDLNHGATQVVMVRLPELDEDQVIDGRATLIYKDAINGKERTSSADLAELVERRKGRRSVKRNYAIALVANSIRSAARASNDNENLSASKKLKRGIEKAKDIFGDHDDKNLKRMIKIANEYRKKLI